MDSVANIVVNDVLKEQLEASIKDAFYVFDHENSNFVDVREIGTIVRSLGCWPSEAELQELITAVEDEDQTNFISLNRFLPVMMRLLLDNWAEPLSEKEVSDAFSFLDSTHTGQIRQDIIKQLLTEKGEKMTMDEAEEFLAVAVDPMTGYVDYNKYIQTQLIEPPSEGHRKKSPSQDLAQLSSKNYHIALEGLALPQSSDTKSLAFFTGVDDLIPDSPSLQVAGSKVGPFLSTEDTSE